MARSKKYATFEEAKEANRIRATTRSKQLWNGGPPESVLQKREVIRTAKIHGCLLCDEVEPATLDFHHTDASNKDGIIAAMVNSNTSLKTMIKEIEKCVVVCSNCHRKIHAGIVSLI